MDRTKYKICPECKKKALYLADSFFFICLECDEYFYVEEFIDEEPELFDEFGDKIVY